MEFVNFFDVYRQMEPLLKENDPVAAPQKWEEASSLLEQAARQFPNEQSALMVYRLRLAGRRGDIQGAIAILDSALSQGHFLPYTSAVGLDYVLGSVSAAPELQPLLERNAACFREFVRTTKNHVLIVEPPPSVKPPPLLIGLHGNGTPVEREAEQYRSITAKGWLLAMPESVTHAFESLPVWTEEEIDREQVQRFYTELPQTHSFDDSCIVVAGMSAGGYTTVHVTLSGIIPARGFIVLASHTRGYPPNRERLIPLIDASRERGVRAYVIVGDQDTRNYEETLALAELLKERNLPCELEVHAGLGHDFPPNFEQSLDRALNFILQAP